MPTNAPSALQSFQLALHAHHGALNDLIAALDELRPRLAGAGVDDVTEAVMRSMITLGSITEALDGIRSAWELGELQ